MSFDADPQHRLRPLEALAVVGVTFGLFIAMSVSTVLQGWSAASRGRLDDAGLLQVLVIELVQGLLAVAFLRWRGHPLGELLPRPTMGGTLVGALLVVAVGLANAAVVAALFDRNEIALQPVAQMVAERSTSLPVVLVVSAVNGLYEEAFLLGYLMRGLSRAGKSIAIGVPLLIRLLYHVYQGPMGVTSVLVYGAIAGVLFWRQGRLWPIVTAHVVFDVVGLA